MTKLKEYEILKNNSSTTYTAPIGHYFEKQEDGSLLIKEERKPIQMVIEKMRDFHYSNKFPKYILWDNHWVEIPFKFKLILEEIIENE